MNPTISAAPVPAGWVERMNLRSNDLVDYENGGPALGVVPSDAENNAYEWTCECVGNDVRVYRDGVAPVVVLSEPGITLVSFAFDQAMNVHVVYVASGVVKFRYWDTLSTAYATMTIPGARTPRCCSDEKTPYLSADRDVVVAYLVGTELKLRLQQDRYLVEYTKAPPIPPHQPITTETKLVSVGMNTGRRLQWRFT